MPWDASTFKSRHNHGLSGEQAGKAASIANAILRRTGDEGLAIRTANARAHSRDSGGGVSNAAQDVLMALSNPAGLEAVEQGLSPNDTIGVSDPSQPSSAPDNLADARDGGAIERDMGGGMPFLPQIGAQMPQTPMMSTPLMGQQPQMPVPSMPQQPPPQMGPAPRVMPMPGPGMPQSNGLPPAPGLGIGNAGVGLTGKAEGGLVPGLAVGGFDMAKGQMGRPPPYARGAERQLHVGPVLSAVPGRTDNHQVKVPAGSYVLPAQHIASMGHGNSVAGLSLASKMFTGPYGAGAGHMGGGSHFPHAPKPMTNYAWGGTTSEGGARGTNDFSPVDVDISGGEYVIPPWAIIARWGNLKHGHQILDKWVMDTRKKEIQTQKNLPPPAKKWMGGAVWSAAV